MAYAKRLPEGTLVIHGPGTEEEWYGTHTYQPDGLWNHAAEMMRNLGESGHAVFRATRAID